MRTELTPVRVKILLSILKMKEKELSAANIAKTLHISKSTVSRAADSFANEKILYEKELKFTPYGEKQVKRIDHEKEILQNWFISEGGMSFQEAEDQAIHLLLCTAEQTRELLIEKLASATNRCALCDVDGFCEMCIDYLLADGEYSIAYTIYKDNSKEHLQVSMANEGFCHPGILRVKDGVGYVYLKSKRLVRPLPTGKGMMSGQVDEVAYLMNHQFKAAVRNNNIWSFPTSCMKFTYNKGEGVLLGSAPLKMKCSSGSMYMPESVAIFTLALVL